MASDEGGVGGEIEEYDVIEEVTDIQIESEDDDEGERILPVHYSELLLDKDTDKEIELFLRQELIPEHVHSEEDLKQKKHTSEQTGNTTEAGFANPSKLTSDFSKITPEQVDKPLEINKYVPLKSKGFVEGNDRTETLKDKQVPNKDVEDVKQIGIGTEIVVENVGSSSVEIVEDSGSVLKCRSSNESNQEMLNVRVEEADAEAKSVSGDKKTSYSETNSEASPVWDNYILVVKGLPPRGVRVS
jgi:hypothetical protein